jgi:CDGSH-type Zn-finger protein
MNDDDMNDDGPTPSQPPSPAATPARPPGKPQRGPFVQRCSAGKHAWCRCGASADYPLCDGTHRGSAVSPLKITLAAETTVVWCACGHTANPPFCDGSHSRLAPR